MPAIHIRDLSQATLERLRARARRNDRSLQAELKSILEEAANTDWSGTRTLAAKLRKSLGQAYALGQCRAHRVRSPLAMSRYVLDANVPIKWFVPENLTPQAVRLLESDHRFIVPDLVYPEVGNALWQKLRRRQITMSEARAALDGIVERSVHDIPDPRAGVLSSGAGTPARLHGLRRLLPQPRGSLRLPARHRRSPRFSRPSCQAPFVNTCCHWPHCRAEPPTTHAPLVSWRGRITKQVMVDTIKRPRKLVEDETGAAALVQAYRLGVKGRKSTAAVSRLYIAPAILTAPVVSSSAMTALRLWISAMVSSTFFRATASTKP